MTQQTEPAPRPFTEAERTCALLKAVGVLAGGAAAVAALFLTPMAVAGISLAALVAAVFSLAAEKPTLRSLADGLSHPYESSPQVVTVLFLLVGTVIATVLGAMQPRPPVPLFVHNALTFIFAGILGVVVTCLLVLAAMGARVFRAVLFHRYRAALERAAV